MPIGAIFEADARENRERSRVVRLQRRNLRDSSDPLSLSHSAFISLYRVNKEAFSYVLDQIAPQLKGCLIPPPIQLATALRFLAVGSFQAVIGRDSDISLARTTVCKVLWNIINVLENSICPNWIQLNMPEEEGKQSKVHFFNSFGIPGIVGCIDGTHIRHLKPTTDESLYLNRKGYFSVNAMIICDYKMRIRYVDACRPGASHDAMIWKLSGARRFFRDKYNDGDHCSWFLADSAYPLEAYLLTPYRDPSVRSAEHIFNKKHASARNVVERVIGNLKSRFRCLQCTLHSTPEKVVKIVNVSCALHNVCKHFNANITDDYSETNESSHQEDIYDYGYGSEHDRQNSNRNHIASQIVNSIQ